MHELLTAAAGATPVPGNAHGSYLTMRSKDGLIFGVINIIGNFATVFQDQAYWQRAIASRPETTVKAYLVGGLAWYIPCYHIMNGLTLSLHVSIQVCHPVHIRHHPRIVSGRIARRPGYETALRGRCVCGASRRCSCSRAHGSSRGRGSPGALVPCCDECHFSRINCCQQLVNI